MIFAGKARCHHQRGTVQALLAKIIGRTILPGKKNTLDWFLSASETKKKSFTTSTLENSFKRAAKIFSRSRYWKLVDKSASRKTIIEKIYYLVLQIRFNSQRTEELTKTAT
jgi:hypothetical protein